MNPDLVDTYKMNKRKVPIKSYAEIHEEFVDERIKKKKCVSIKVEKSRYEESESSSEESSSDNEYEQVRLRNIAERDRLFRSLGFDKALQELEEVKIKKEITKRIKKRTEIIPRREPSRRIMQLAANTEIKKEEFEEEKFEEEGDNRLLLEEPMKLENEQSQLLFETFKFLKDNTEHSDHYIDIKSCDLTKFKEAMGSLSISVEPTKVVSKRIQSLCVHPNVSKRLAIAGGVGGDLGLWDIDQGSQMGVMNFHPHRGPINCLTVSPTDTTKIFSTSHDGTIVCADMETSIFSNIYATDHHSKINHLMWHEHLDAHNLLLCHGNGSVGLLDLRESQLVKTWIPCFEKSARTVQCHPTKRELFLVSSGAGCSCNIYDMRKCSNTAAESVCKMPHPKGLTSAFFSPSGDQVLSTCNDDKLRTFSVKSMVSRPPVQSTTIHNNHTGRWLSVFKAMWHPLRDDAFLIGSLLNPRRIQIYGLDGKLLGEMIDQDKLSTICSVISVHKELPFLVGGNSSGRLFVFSSKSC